MTYKLLRTITLFSTVVLLSANGFEAEQFESAAGAEGNPTGGFGEPEPNIGGLGGEESGGAEAPDLDGDGVPDAFDLDSPGGLGGVPPSEQGVGEGAPDIPSNGQSASDNMAFKKQMHSDDNMADKNGMAGGDPEKKGLSPEEERVFELIEMYHKKQSKARG